jgi:hypothetical protein
MIRRVQAAVNFLTVVTFIVPSAFALQPPARRPQGTTKPQPKRTAPMTPVEPARAEIGAPLAIDLERLPTHYPGDDIVAVVRSLDAGPKGEFETTADYATRVASIRPTRTYSFWLDRPILRRYDADRQTVKISIPTTCVYVGYSANCSIASLAVKFVESKNGQYVGTNAFGATTVVSSVSRSTYAVLLPRNRLSVDFELAMPSDVARVAMDTVDVLITVGPSADTASRVLVQGSSSSSATFSSPLESREVFQYLALPVVAIWLANRSSGVILAKHDSVP